MTFWQHESYRKKVKKPDRHVNNEHKSVVGGNCILIYCLFIICIIIIIYNYGVIFKRKTDQ